MVVVKIEKKNRNTDRSSSDDETIETHLKAEIPPQNVEIQQLHDQEHMAPILIWFIAALLVIFMGVKIFFIVEFFTVHED